MYEDIISMRLKKYTINSIDDEENALKEILQEVLLYGLSTTDFFRKALFQGGTALRILHDLPRFSEDLDFILMTPEPLFRWETYFVAIKKSCALFAIEPSVIDKDKAGSNVKKMFLKDDSIGKILNLNFHHSARKKLTIKLEIDTNPPEGSQAQIKFLDFPIDYSINAQDLSSNFAGKCHALLCREYIKGRDWYDFTWYTQQKIVPNLTFLQNALKQQGPWKNQSLDMSLPFLAQALIVKIKTIDWEKAKADVAPFLRPLEKQSIALWGEDFFIDKALKLDPSK